MKALLKKIFQKAGYRLIKEDFLENHYHKNDDSRYRKSGDLNPLDQLFYQYLPDDFFFIQVGANNGKRYDPIHHLIVAEKEQVSGIAIEPVGEYFNELQQTYSGFPNIKLLKKAIHNSEDSAVIYKINPALPQLGEHLKGMSSFDISNLLKDGISRNDIVEEKVDCISLMDLVKEEKISKIHLLQIDAEGYDLEIIKSIDFNLLKPCIINFEHRWQYKLAPEAELFSVFKKLIDHGYQVVLNGNDALAYLYQQ
jgi:FkbM family methyltransferase